MAYKQRQKYTAKELTCAYLHDLIVDIRCARRDGLDDYAEQCLQKLQGLWPHRHQARIGQWGIPEVPR